MPDREKVMSWLEGLSEPDWRDFHSDSEVQNIAKSALALLKEQEKPNGKCVNECECWDSAYERGKQDVLKEQEGKKGQWIPIESPTGIEAFGVKEMTVMNVRCSVCGSEEDVSFTGYKYCPRCGTKMEGR